MDSRFYRDVNRFAINTPWAHSPMKALAVYGVGLFALLLVVTWWYARRAADPHAAVAASLWTAAAVFISLGVNQLIGHAIDRARPYAVVQHVEVLVTRSHDASFPSDHSIVAGSAAAGLWLVAHFGGKANRVAAIVGTLLALFVAFSRVYVGAHYPGDVVAGLGVGAAIALLGWLAVRRPFTWAVVSLARQDFIRPLIAAESRPRHRRLTT